MTKNEIKNELKNRVAEKVENRKARLSYKRETRHVVVAWEAAGRPYWNEPEAKAHQARCREISGSWEKNAGLKQEIRNLQLALAFLRGRRYWECERSHGEDNGPDFYQIQKLTGAGVDALDAWLSEKPSEEEAAAYQAHLDAAKEKAREAKRAAAVSRRRAA